MPAFVLICVVFGWSGGSKLVSELLHRSQAEAGGMKASRGPRLNLADGRTEA